MQRYKCAAVQARAMSEAEAAYAEARQLEKDNEVLQKEAETQNAR